MHIHPTREQFADFSAQDSDEPVVMLNLIRFEESAKPGMGADGLTGEQAYRRYIEAFGVMQQRYESELVFLGTGHPAVIGPVDERWDLVLLVRYPTRKAFTDMATDPEYLESIVRLRTAAVADSRLIPMTPLRG